MCNMLRTTSLQSVAFKCYDRLAGACKSWVNNVGICCVEMLRSFGLGFKPKQIVTRSLMFSRALRQLHACTSSFDWPTIRSVFFVIG